MQNDQNNQTSTAKMVGLDTSITLVGINGDNPFRAKVDTGAEECSLDAQELDDKYDDISGSGTVSFVVGEYRYNMPIAGYQAISSADGGTTNRPTIRIGVRMGEEYFPDIVFNLNDRSGMEYPVLLGSNFLKLAGLTVDPKLSEAIEVTFLDQEEAKQAGEGDTVDVSPQIQDNTDSDVEVDALTAWFMANKHKTLGQLMTELMKTGSSNDGKD